MGCLGLWPARVRRQGVGEVVSGQLTSLISLGRYASPGTSTLESALACWKRWPGCLAHRARSIHLHLPEHWPWQAAWNNPNTISATNSTTAVNQNPWIEAQV